jgi:hypothetical protein
MVLKIYDFTPNEKEFRKSQFFHDTFSAAKPIFSGFVTKQVLIFMSSVKFQQHQILIFIWYWPNFYRNLWLNRLKIGVFSLFPPFLLINIKLPGAPRKDNPALRYTLIV